MEAGFHDHTLLEVGKGLHILQNKELCKYSFVVESFSTALKKLDGSQGKYILIF